MDVLALLTNWANYVGSRLPTMQHIFCPWQCTLFSQDHNNSDNCILMIHSRRAIILVWPSASLHTVILCWMVPCLHLSTQVHPYICPQCRNLINKIRVLTSYFCNEKSISLGTFNIMVTDHYWNSRLIFFVKHVPMVEPLLLLYKNIMLLWNNRFHFMVLAIGTPLLGMS